MASITEFSRLSAILTLDIAGFMKNSEIAQARLARFGTAATRVGQTLSRGLGLGLALVGGAAVATAAEFNKVSVQLRALVKRDAFQALTKQARQLGEATIFTRIEIANAQKELAKLGTSGVDIQQIIPGIASLAGALDEDLAESAAGVKEALNIFGLDANKATEVTDLFAQAVQSSALTIPQLREGLKNIGPILAQQGLSIERTVALLALLANSAIKGSTAGTKLRSTFNKLAKEGFIDANKSLALLQKNTLDYTELLDLLNSRSVVVGSVVKDQSDALQELIVAFESTAGATDILADEFEGELFYTVEQLKNAFQSLGIEIGNSLKPTVESLRDSLISITRGFQTLTPESKTFIGNTIAISVAASAATFILGQLSIAAAALATPVGALVVGLAALGVAFYQAFGDQVSINNDIAITDQNLRKLRGELETIGELGDQAALKRALDIGQESFDELDRLGFRINILKKDIEQLSDGSLSSRLNNLFGGALDRARIELDIRENEYRFALANYNTARKVTKDVKERVTLLQYLEETVTQVNAKEQERQLKEAQALVTTKKITALNERINDILKKRQTQELPTDEQEVERINIQFDALKRKMIELGGSVENLEAVREAMIAIATASSDRKTGEFLDDLKASFEIFKAKDAGDGLTAKLKQIDLELEQAKRAAKERGTLVEEEAILEEIALRKKRNAYEEYHTSRARTAKDNARALEDFTKQELEAELVAITRHEEDLLKQFEGNEAAKQKIRDAANAKRAKAEDDFARKEQRQAISNLRAVSQLTDAIGSAFSDAITKGTDFFESLRKSFLSFFSAIIGKLVALVALFAVLSVLSGTGATKVGKLATTALGGQNLGQFVGAGLGGFTNRSAQGGASISGFGSRIDGTDIVVSNQMSGRQMTRIGG